MKKMILVDSCCNLPSEFYSNNNDLVEMISMPVKFGDDEFLDDHGKTVSYSEFYDGLRKGKVASTSQINPTEFLSVFRNHYERGNELVYVSFSSGMSGTFGSASIAREMLLDDHPDAKVTIVDSLCASSGYGALVHSLVSEYRNNPDMDIESYISGNRLSINHFFTVDDLMFLKRGGRIPASTAMIGTALNIKPLMHMTMDGKLEKGEKAKGRKKALKSIAESFAAAANGNTRTVVIGHGDCEDDAVKMKELLLEAKSDVEVIISCESPTIGSHVGPGLIVIGFLGEERVE